MHETLIKEITENHLFPMTLMLEYRSGSLDNSLQDRISGILQDNLSKQAELPLQEPYKSLILDKPITQTDLEQWKAGILKPPKRQIAIDQYIKASLATLSDNKELTKIQELNQFVFLHRFEAYAKHYPNHPAILFKEQTLTYAQLNSRANQLAGFLQKQKQIKGIKDQKIIVGTFLPREPDWIIAILAIWKAGDAFIAIDPTAIGNSPDAIDDYFEKFAQIISDGKPSFIMTHSDHQYLLPKPEADSFICLCLDECQRELDNGSDENLGINIDPEDLAYILYTSGSTGKPKGVEIAHRGFMPCLEAHRECVDLTRDSIMAQYATCDFDAWVAEMLILGVGGTLAIVPSDIRLDEKRCARYYQEHKISIAIFTPAFLNKLGGPENFPLWRALFIVGESFDWELVKKWKTEKLQIVNGYGLTETTICATLENLDMEDVGKPLSIGKPIVGTKILIKIPTNIDVNNPDIEKDYGPETSYQDPESSSSAIDQAGEPWFGGISLTRGYRGEAMQNNAWRLVKIEGECYYKSGDKAILRADGRLEHQGRYSRMVKISGKRIELPSIEANVCQQFQLEKMAVAVTAVGNSLNDKNLTTILVFLKENEQKKIDLEEIRNFIINNEKNIDKQTPLYIIWKKAFPTTQTKINLAELNKLYFEFHTKQSTASPVVQDQMSAQETDIFNKLNERWKSVISIENLKPKDDFFLIGGRSIDISPLIQALRREFPQLKEEITNNFVLECRTLLSQTKRIYSLQHPVELIPLKKKQETDSPYIVFCPPSILGDPEQDYTTLFSHRDETSRKPIFDERFQIYGLKARGLTNPSLMPTSLYSMAQDYALTIKGWLEKEGKEDRPVFILGWSSGGTVTPEIVNALEKYAIQAYAYVCDSIAPFPFHHFNHEEHTRELVLLASNLSEAIGLKLDKQDLKTELSKIQKPRDRISHCFDYLIQKAKKHHHNILDTAKIIRLAEHNYIIRDEIHSIRLYKAKKYLLNDILPEDRAHYWPKKSIYNLSQLHENIIEGDHFEMIRQTSLAQQIATQIIHDFTYHKLKKIVNVLETQSDYVIPFIEVIEPKLNEHEQKNNPSILFSHAIADFLQNPEKKVLLIQGESGIGKSISVEQLEKSLKTIQIFTKTIFMNRYTCEELKNGIREKLNEWKKESCEIRVLILEGYDERQGTIDFNYYDTNGLSDYQNLKVIFTCRSETLRPGYLINFIPRKWEALDEFKLERFTEDQIKALMSICLKKNTIEPDNRELEKLYSEIKSHSELPELVKNPLLLTFVLRSLPILLKSTEKLTRFKIYEVFNQDYFERGEQKVKSQSGVEQNQNFQLACRLHCQRIALAFFAEELTSYEVIQNKGKSLLSALKKVSSPIDDLFDQRHKYLLKASPLDSKNNIHQFNHKSELEYFVADALITIFKEENVDFSELQTWFIESKLLPQKLVSNESIVKFWAEGYRQYPKIKTTLDKIVTETRNNEQIKTLGGIAITLLNMAGEFFNGANLRGIRVPRAVLSGGYFDCADFTGSDLTDVIFFRAWLRNTRLNNCQLNGVNFGEYPYFKHNDAVWSMDFRPEINRLVTASKNIVYIWDVELVQCIEEFKTPMKCIDRVSMSDNGKKIALVGFDNTVRVLNLTSREIIELNGHNAPLASVYISRDGSKVASGSRDHTVRVWDLMNNHDTVLGKHDDTVTSVHLSADSSRLASGSDDKSIRVWNVANAQLIAILHGHEREVTCVHLSADGSTVASGSLDKTIRLWEIATGRSKVLKGHKFQITSIYLSDDGRKVVSGSGDFTVRVWEASSGASIVLSGHRDSVVSVRLSDDGLILASAGFTDKTVRRWDLSTNQSLARHIHTDNHNRTLVLGSWDDSVTINDFSSNRPIVLHTVQSKPLSNDKRDKIFNVPFKVDICLMPRFQSQSIELGKPKRLILDEHISKNRQIIASASDRNDKSVRLINLANGITKILEGHVRPVTCSHLSEDGRIVVSGSQDFTVRVWEVESGKSLVLEGHKHIVSCVYLSKDGQTVVSGSWDKTVRIWDVSNSKSIILSGHEKEVSCVHMCLNKTRVFSGSWDGTVRMWDVISGLPLAVISSSEGVLAISLNESANILIVEYGLCIRVWDRLDDRSINWKLRWSSHTNQSINLTGCEFTGSKDLSNQNQALITQRGGFDTTTKPISHTQNPTVAFDDFDKLSQIYFESKISSAKIADSQSSPKLIRKDSETRDKQGIRFFSQGMTFDPKSTSETQTTYPATNESSSDNESKDDFAMVTKESDNKNSSVKEDINAKALTAAEQEISDDTNDPNDNAANNECCIM